MGGSEGVSSQLCSEPICREYETQDGEVSKWDHAVTAKMTYGFRTFHSISQ